MHMMSLVLGWSGSELHHFEGLGLHSQLKMFHIMDEIHDFIDLQFHFWGRFGTDSALDCTDWKCTQDSGGSRMPIAVGSESSEFGCQSGQRKAVGDTA